ncbi:hypothetical protein [uncultured Brachyspira sp.]|uniref:hypothetical protein n=1 Tax=uncultured Brachyspira sp. TaxID=221953 RepID=UPI002628B5C6|nr:hypothetical protein [uncultured Brachyspira sp.]
MLGSSITHKPKGSAAVNSSSSYPSFSIISLSLGYPVTILSTRVDTNLQELLTHLIKS